jgi:hypothetical protein
VFLARLRNSEECPHAEFTEVAEVPWLVEGIGMALASLVEGYNAGATPDDMLRAIDHALIIIAAAGMAAGKAEAANLSATLSGVDWDHLPDVYGD